PSPPPPPPLTPLFPYTTLFRSLNNNEINKYLTVSLSQFKTHSPKLRFEAMKEQYYKDYWYPNVEPDHYSKMSEYENKYFGHVFKDRKSTRLNSSHVKISYAVFC